MTFLLEWLKCEDRQLLNHCSCYLIIVWSKEFYQTFNNCVKQGVLPNILKMADILPVHKKIF